MTYAELLALINPANAVVRTDGVSAMGDTPGYSTTTVVPDWYYADPNNPLGGAVQDLGGGALSYWLPRDTMTGNGGQDVTQYGANGQVDNQWFAQNTQNWQDTLRGMVGTIGGAALLGNAGALLGAGGAAAAPEAGAFTFASPEAAQAAATWGSGGAAEVAGGAGASALSGGVAPAATSVAPAATGGIGSTGAAAAATGAGTMANGAFLGEGVASGVPAWDAAAGSGVSGGTDWMSLLRQGAGALNGNGGLLSAGLGALAGVAGNGDLTNTQTGSSGLASWMQPYAQDVVARQQFMANQPATNWALDTSQGLLGNYAVHGTPLTNAAMQQQQNVIGGGMLGSNPYIDKVAGDITSRMSDAYATGTRAGQMGAAAQSGNWGSSSANEALQMKDRAFADSLGSTLNNLYFGNYSQERAAQDAAARGSTGLANFGVQNAGLLGQSGADAWQRPYTQLQNYQSALSPAFGQQTSSTQNIQAPNNWLAGAGGAAMGAGLWKSIFG